MAKQKDKQDNKSILEPKTDEEQLKEFEEEVKEAGAKVGFDNDGNLISRNRAYRRRRVKLPGSNRFTKFTPTRKQIKKRRKKGRRKGRK